MHRPPAPFGPRIPQQQQAGSTIEELIRTAKARIASIDAQMTAVRDMTAERASLAAIVANAEAQLAPPGPPLAAEQAAPPAPEPPVKSLPRRMA
jgi:outer membrane protein TolC